MKRVSRGHVSARLAACFWQAEAVGKPVVAAAEARRYAEGEPFYQKGLRSFEIHEWVFMEGSMTVTLNFAELHAVRDVITSPFNSYPSQDETANEFQGGCHANHRLYRRRQYR